MAILNVKNLPDPLYRKLKARAKAQRRSIAQEVAQILSDALESPPAAALVRERAVAAWAAAPDPMARLRGRATSRLTTDEIMALTRGTPPR